MTAISLVTLITSSLLGPTKCSLWAQGCLQCGEMSSFTSSPLMGTDCSDTESCLFNALGQSRSGQMYSPSLNATLVLGAAQWRVPTSLESLRKALSKSQLCAVNEKEEAGGSIWSCRSL